MTVILIEEGSPKPPCFPLEYADGPLRSPHGSIAGKLAAFCKPRLLPGTACKFTSSHGNLPGTLATRQMPVVLEPAIGQPKAPTQRRAKRQLLNLVCRFAG